MMVEVLVGWKCREVRMYSRYRMCPRENVLSMLREFTACRRPEIEYLFRLSIWLLVCVPS